MAASGAPQPFIAAELGIDKKTLAKYYREELDYAMARRNVRVAQTLFGLAMGWDGNPPDRAACMFWLKSQAGWRETSRTEHTGADGKPIQIAAGPQIDVEKLSESAKLELMKASDDEDVRLLLEDLGEQD